MRSIPTFFDPVLNLSSPFSVSLALYSVFPLSSFPRVLNTKLPLTFSFDS